MTTTLRLGLVGALLAGLLAAAPAAGADDDRRTRSGDCSGRSWYRMTLIDVDRDDRDRLRLKFFVNSNRADVTWKVRVRRNGNLVAKASPTTNRWGNFTVKRTFRGDDDDYVKVRAVRPNGEVCVRGFRLDPDD